MTHATTFSSVADRAQSAGLRLRLRSEERRITSQHEKLDALCREVYLRVDKDGPRLAIGDFLLFATAMDAHMTVEEDVYFPAIHGSRPDVGADLERLAMEHARLRRMLERVKRALRRGDRETSMQYLDELGRQIEVHEAEEEDLIVRVNEGPLLARGHVGL